METADTRPSWPCTWQPGLERDNGFCCYLLDADAQPIVPSGPNQGHADCTVSALGKLPQPLEAQSAAWPAHYPDDNLGLPASLTTFVGSSRSGDPEVSK